MKTKCILLVLFFAFICFNALGFGPPKEASSACNGKSEGAPCSFTTSRGHTLKGTCKNMHGSSVCVPEGHRQGGGQQGGGMGNQQGGNMGNQMGGGMGNQMGGGMGKKKPKFSSGKASGSECKKTVKTWSKIPDTGQVKAYNNTQELKCPKNNGAFFGQDAHYQGQQPSYKDNGNGTVTDLVTGLMWSKAVDKKKLSLVEAKKIAPTITIGGYSDWRVPDIKEMYSLIDFKGYTGFGSSGYKSVPSNAVPYINTDYFDFRFGDTTAGERYIDAQWLTTTMYVSTTMNGAKTLFGVNFADGRIKGYGFSRRNKKFYVRYVRGNGYGSNDFFDNRDGTVTDRAAGLMWMQNDSGKGMNWQAALKYAEGLDYGGYSDWRLPNAKELQYIVDYSCSPDTTDSPAIDPIFKTTSIKNEAGKKDFPFFWTSTTHLDGPQPGANAAYVSFGRAIGQMRGTIMDVHGAGAQRSDRKKGSPQLGHGPQGDAVRVNNYVRCVRSIK